MKAIEETLASIVRYYAVNRRVGHTAAILKGVDNVQPAPLLMVHARSFRPTKVELITAFDCDRLMGRAQALVIDHLCIQVLMQEAVNRIAELRAERDTANQAWGRSDDLKRLAERRLAAVENELVAMKEKLKRSRAKVRALKGLK